MHQKKDGGRVLLIITAYSVLLEKCPLDERWWCHGIPSFKNLQLFHKKDIVRLKLLHQTEGLGLENGQFSQTFNHFKEKLSLYTELTERSYTIYYSLPSTDRQTDTYTHVTIPITRMTNTTKNCHWEDKFDITGTPIRLNLPRTDLMPGVSTYL